MPLRVRAIALANHNVREYKDGERMDEKMSLDELKQITIDYYVNLQRIKKADTGNNQELEYQLRVVKNTVASLGIPAEDYEI